MGDGLLALPLAVYPGQYHHDYHKERHQVKAARFMVFVVLVLWAAMNGLMNKVGPIFPSGLGYHRSKVVGIICLCQYI
jgi:hypothetical protein